MTSNGQEASIITSSSDGEPLAWLERKSAWVRYLFRLSWVFPWIAVLLWTSSLFLYRDGSLFAWIILGSGCIGSGIFLSFKKNTRAKWYLGMVTGTLCVCVFQRWLLWDMALTGWLNLLILHMGLQECKRDEEQHQAHIERILNIQRDQQAHWEEKERMAALALQSLYQERDVYRAQLEQQQEHLLCAQREVNEMIQHKEDVVRAWTQAQPLLPMTLVEAHAPDFAHEISRWKGLYHQLREQFADKSAHLDASRKKVFELEGELEIKSLEMQEALQAQATQYQGWISQANQELDIDLIAEENAIAAEQFITFLLEEDPKDSTTPGS